MAIIKPTDASSAPVNGFQFDDLAAVGMAQIPAGNHAVGWYRVATIDRTNITNVPYVQIFMMTSGQYASGEPTEFALVITAPSQNNGQRTRVTELSSYIGGNYTRVRVGLDGTSNVVIDVYQANSASAQKGRQAFFIACTGGRLQCNQTAVSATTPTPLFIDYALQGAQTSGAVSIERKYPSGASTAGQYIVFARFPLGNSSSKAQASLLVGGGGNYASIKLGAFILDCGGKGTNTCQQTTLVSPGSATGMEFGSYTQDGYVYVGMKRPAYSSEFTVKVLNYATNVTSKYSPIELDTFYNSTTAPTGWTAATT